MKRHYYPCDQQILLFINTLIFLLYIQTKELPFVMQYLLLSLVLLNQHYIVTK